MRQKKNKNIWTGEEVYHALDRLNPIEREVVCQWINEISDTIDLELKYYDRFDREIGYDRLNVMEDRLYDELKKMTGLEYVFSWPILQTYLDFGKRSTVDPRWNETV